MSGLPLDLIAAIAGGIILGAYFIPFKFSQLTANQYLLIMFIFSTLTLAAFLIFSKGSTSFHIGDFGFPIVSGVLFGVSLFLVFFSINSIGINRAAAIYVGLQLVVAVVIGIAFFNELGPLSSSQKIETVTGIILVMSGVVLISIAKL
jgi:glucose uptake protein GlcU